MSEQLKSCVEQVMDQGHDEQAAYAICRASLGEGNEDEKKQAVQEAGRTLSQKNESELADALEKIIAVLSQVSDDYNIEPLKQAAQDYKNETSEHSESGELLETQLRRDGTVPVKVISAGWGSSGYYPQEVLERDASMYKEGTHMYWDHPKSSDEFERPERTLRDLAGVLVSDGQYRENGPAGAGIYADAQVFGPFKDAVSELGQHIGVSHRARGRSYTGEAEGQRGTIVDAIEEVLSVDFVTVPGRGGEIVQLMESKREGGEEMNLQEATVEQIKEKRADLVETLTADIKSELEEAKQEKENALQEAKRLQEAVNLQNAKMIVEMELDGEDVPEETKSRLREQLKNSAQYNDKEEYDEAKTKEVVQEAIKAEKEYIEKLSGSGKIRGFGESQKAQEDYDAKFEEALKRL